MVDFELTMVVVEYGETPASLECVYDAVVAAMRGPAPCHSGGGGFAPKVFSVAEVLDALSCCDFEIRLTFGGIAFCPIIFSVSSWPRCLSASFGTRDGVHCSLSCFFFFFRRAPHKERKSSQYPCKVFL